MSGWRLIEWRVGLVCLLSLVGCAELWGQNADLPKVEQRSIFLGGGDRENLFSFGGRIVRLDSDESVRDAFVVTGGIHVDGEIDGNLVVVAGSAEINGRVRGDVIIVGGSASFGPGAEILGDTFLMGGPFELDQDAVFHGDQTEVLLDWLLPAFRSLGTLLASTVLLGRPFAPQLTWTWWLVGGLFIVNLLILLLMPRPTRASVSALRESPVTAFVVGMAVLLLFAPLLFLLVFSGFGILLIPFLLCVAVATVLLGKVVVYASAGQQVVTQFSLRNEIQVLAFTIGSLVFLGAYMVPVIGFLAVGLVIPLGVGAVILAGCRAFRGEMGINPVDTAGVAGMSKGLAFSGTVAGGGGSQGASESVAAEALLPEGIVDRVGFWPRIAASGLDLILVGFLFSILVGDTGPGTTRLMIFSWLLYHFLMWALKGATLGGMIIGIRCVTIDRQALSWGTAGVRVLGSVFSTVALFLGFFWASWSRERQSWHDMIAGTIMIRVPKLSRVKKAASPRSETVVKTTSESDEKTVS